MTTFSYRAIGAAGGAERGRIEAASAVAAKERLRERGLIALDVRAEGSLASLGAARRRRGAAAGRRERAWFFTTLHRLLASKAPLDAAVSAMEELAPSERAKSATARVREALRGGAPAHEAVRGAGLATADQAALLRVGHESGRLERAAELIARSIATRERIRRTVVGRLIYPATLVVFAVAALSFLSWFVIPRFAATLASVGAELPWSTRATLGASRAMACGAPAAAVVVGAAVVWLKRGAPERARGAMAAWALRAPVVREVVWNGQAAVACETMATMVEGGADVLGAMALAEEAVSNREIRARLARARGAVREGRGVAEALHEAGALPAEADALVRVGVRSGDLAGSLRRATEHCLEAQERLTARLLTLMEPAVILVMAGAVLWIVSSLISGMLSINDMGAM